MFERAHATERIIARVRSQPPPISLGTAARLLIDELERLGVDLRREPSLDEAKRLVVAAVRAAGLRLPPLRIFVRRGRLDLRPAAPAIGPGLPAGDAAMRPMEILLVEDSLTFARATMRALREGRIEHRLTWLSRGDDAMDYLRRRGRFAGAAGPDLILLDLGLPGKDGREVLAEIDEDYDLRGIPVIVLTASSDEEDRIVSRLQGVKGYMTKPVNLSEFLRLVRSLKAVWRDDVILPTW